MTRAKDAPDRMVATFLWHRDTDTFTLGQWLVGRIYERRADLSPDGRHMIYFARDARWHSETGGSWTAVSRSPWLRALTLWAKGDCWQGGGLFVDNGRCWLNGCHRLLSDDSAFAFDAPYPTGGYGAECLGVYYPRLLRDGWTLAEPVRPADWIDRFEKPLTHGWTLVKLAHRPAQPPPGRGCYWDEHCLVRARSGTVSSSPCRDRYSGNACRQMALSSPSSSATSTATASRPGRLPTETVGGTCLVSQVGARSVPHYQFNARLTAATASITSRVAWFMRSTWLSTMTYRRPSPG